MSKQLVPLTLITVLIACSDDPAQLPPDSGAVVDSGSQDSGTHDTGVSDSGLHDSGNEDLGFADSGFDSGFDSGAPDLGFDDAGEEDASEPDSGSSMCNGVGEACDGVDPCPNGLLCGQEGFCVPMADCGGFVRRQCMAPRSMCLFYAGADYGPCFNAAERACVCNNPLLAVHFPDC
jgi:hypothetical protein